MPVLTSGRSEAEIEQGCRHLAEAKGCKLLKISAQRGWPDRILLVPPGIASFMEFKKESGVLRPLQAHRLQECRDLGFRADVVRSEEQFLLILRSLASSPRSGFLVSTRNAGSTGS